MSERLTQEERSRMLFEQARGWMGSEAWTYFCDRRKLLAEVDAVRTELASVIENGEQRELEVARELDALRAERDEARRLNNWREDTPYALAVVPDAERRGFEACRETIRCMCEDFAGVAEECHDEPQRKAWVSLRDCVANLQPGPLGRERKPAEPGLESGMARIVRLQDAGEIDAETAHRLAYEHLRMVYGKEIK